MGETSDNKLLLRNENKLLDILKLIAALLIAASHCLPLAPNNDVNFFYGQWFFRFCVPFFLISSGYFFSSFPDKVRIQYIKRIAITYCLSSLLYLPFYMTKDITAMVQSVLFGYQHLWYLSALLLALILCFVIEKTPLCRIFNKLYPFIALLLIIIGAFYDEYQHIFIQVKDIPLVSFIGKIIQVSGGHRHALFFAFPMLLIGKFLYEHQNSIRLSKAICILLIILSLFASFAECLLLRHFGGESITCDITLLNYLPAMFLFILTFSCRPKALEAIHTKAVRKVADIIYISHVLVILAVDKFLNIAYIPRLVLVLIVSVVVSYLYNKVEGAVRNKLPMIIDRK